MIIEVKVVPNAKTEKVEKLSDGSFKVWLHAKPVEGEANKKLVEILSAYLGVAKSSVKIVKGQRGRQKLVEID